MQSAATHVSVSAEEAVAMASDPAAARFLLRRAADCDKVAAEMVLAAKAGVLDQWVEESIRAMGALERL